MAELAFFIGKGGVGKTTIASAYAARLAERHRRQRILLLSTDPAHSLADIFALPRAASPMRLARMANAAGDLWYWQVDAEQQMQKFLGQHRRAILQVLESGTFFSGAEIGPLLHSALPGMAEMAGGGAHSAGANGAGLAHFPGHHAGEFFAAGSRARRGQPARDGQRGPDHRCGSQSGDGKERGPVS